MTEPATGRRLGFFGKVPARGDFVTRRLPHDFTDPWDDWLQDAIATSNQQLGDAWLDLYLTAPIWRFLLAGSVCGDAAMIGVLMSSVDRVGRYFPLTLAVAVSPPTASVETMTNAGAWFETVETLALSALEDDTDLDRLDAAAEAIAPPDLAQGSPGYRIDRVLALDGMLALLPDRYTLWWTSGSAQFKSSLIIAEGLPPVDHFAALLNDNWEQWGWKTR
jgi:type VI secretion system protein ImpM